MLKDFRFGEIVTSLLDLKLDSSTEPVRSLLSHPDSPRDRPDFLIGYWAARQLEGQLDLTVMVALVPEHVLEQEDRVVVVKIHVPACFHSALYRGSHRLGAFVQHLFDSLRVTLQYPFFVG